MPLRDHLPVIDDRRYEDIVAEALTRIPRFTSEWTDFNPGDPGMAMVELFAWMSELMIYRLGRTPALAYVKFLELIGLELRPAQPARAEVSFAVRPGFPSPSLFLPERTKVSAEGEAGPLIFETEKPLVVLAAELTAVQVFDGYSHRLVSAENADVATAYEPLGSQPDRDAALLLGFEFAGPFPSETFALTVWSADAERPTAATFCGVAPAFGAPANLVWEYFTGSEWRAMTLLSDDTLAFTRSGEIRLTAPPPGEMARGLVGRAADVPRYWIRARVERAAYTRAPKILALRHNTVGVLQAETARDEVLGGSDGSMSQVLRLANRSVIKGTAVIEVDEGDGFVTWTAVDDFFASGPDDTHYVLDCANGEVIFGDGDNGRIPVANVSRPATSIVARHYRFGGGPAGNVGPGAIASLLGAVGGLDANRIENPFSAYGGKAEETLAEAEQRVPHVLRGRDRAVTADDFEQLAVQVGPVRRAKALPLHLPACPGVNVPGAVTVVVVPDSEGDAPVPSDQLLRDVCAYLDPRRLMTTELYVRPPAYVAVRVSAELVATPTVDPRAAQEEALAALATFLDPFVGGEAGTGWPFGGTIYYSALFRRLLVPGILRIASLELEVDGEAIPECTDVPLPPDALIRQLDHSVRVSADAALAGQVL